MKHHLPLQQQPKEKAQSTVVQYAASTLIPILGEDKFVGSWEFKMKILLSLEIALFSLAVINSLSDGYISKLGIHPRQVYGLFGLFTYVFLHRSFGRFFSNALALWVTGAHVLLQPNGFHMFGILFLINMLGGGLLIWAFEDVAIIYEGISGCVISFLVFMIAFGVVTKNIRDVLVAVITIVCWLTFNAMFFGRDKEDVTALWGIVIGLCMGCLDGRAANSGHRLFASDIETDRHAANKFETSSLTAHHNDDQVDEV